MGLCVNCLFMGRPVESKPDQWPTTPMLQSPQYGKQPRTRVASIRIDSQTLVGVPHTAYHRSFVLIMFRIECRAVDGEIPGANL